MPTIFPLRELTRAHQALVGGKAGHLGELSRIEGLRVPEGFCVTTEAYRGVLARAPAIEALLERLTPLKPDAREEIRLLSEEVRRAIEAVEIPDVLAAEISHALAGPAAASWAVRSSATAEDLPTASFAGQQDTYLNVGTDAVIAHVRRCWASLFTERAVTYRARSGVDRRKVLMAVVVQRMVFPEASGVLFTADPVSGHRKVAVVESCFGLGEALVSGRVNADAWKLRDGAIIDMSIGRKDRAIRASPEGGTREVPMAPEQQHQPTLADPQVVRLAGIGRRIEAHFGRPQDIEWAVVEGEFHVLQSRPITTLFPIPANDGARHVYVSVGHQQMMTDPMKALGLSLFQLTALRPMFDAGGRLFVDVTTELASPTLRAGLLAGMGRADPLIRDALETVIARGHFAAALPVSGPAGPPSSPPLLEADPAIVKELMARAASSLEILQREIRGKSGPALVEFILSDLQETKRLLSDPTSFRVLMAGMGAAWWLNEKLEAWLGVKNAADALAQSVPHNVTSEMGLSLLHVADVIRPHPEVVAFLERVENDGFPVALETLAGGPEARDAIAAWLDRYGMRCVGEIDVTRPRWSERPSALVPMILGNVRNFAPGEGERRFEAGRREAARKERDLLERLRGLPDGVEKAAEAKRMIDRVRTFAGYREYPKYALINRFFLYKQALVSEAERLVQAGVIGATEEIFHLTLAELREVVRTQAVDAALLRERQEAFESYRALTPPRVLTSDGECVAGTYEREGVPAGAQVGLAVSSGIVEGRARVIRDLADARFEPGDILVTAWTDPSWTPAFVAIAGLVTEVGGLMTHGAVIAREYGLPAVVGVVDATRLVRDGQRIRVNGTEGWVEIVA